MPRTSWLNQFAPPEQSYLYSDSEEMGSKIKPFGDFELQMAPEIAPKVQQAENQANANLLQTAGTAGTAAALPFMATPQGAAVLVGSQLLMNTMANKAANERQKRATEAEIAQTQGSQEQAALRSMIENLRGSLK